MTILLKVAGYLPPALARALVEMTLAYHMVNTMTKARRLEA